MKNLVNKGLLKESLSEFVNEDYNYQKTPLSTFWDVVVTELQEQFGLSFEKADFAMGAISNQKLEDLEEALDYEERTLSDIAQEIYNIAFKGQSEY